MLLLFCCPAGCCRSPSPWVAACGRNLPQLPKQSLPQQRPTHSTARWVQAVCGGVAAAHPAAARGFAVLHLQPAHPDLFGRHARHLPRTLQSERSECSWHPFSQEGAAMLPSCVPCALRSSFAQMCSSLAAQVVISNMPMFRLLRLWLVEQPLIVPSMAAPCMKHVSYSCPLR